MRLRLTSPFLAGLALLILIVRPPVGRSGEPEHWSFRPVAKSPIPAVKNGRWPISDLDRFVLARLEAAHAALLQDHGSLGSALADLRERHDALLRDRQFAIDHISQALQWLRILS